MDSRTGSISRVTIWGAVINLLLAALKFVAGFVGRSSAMMADAVHSLSDLVSDIVVLAMVRVSSKGKDSSHDYGHGKFETVASAFISLVLLSVGVKLMTDGVKDIIKVAQGGEIEVPGRIALYAALVSIAVKEILYRWTAAVGRKFESPAVIANAWHHRTDALSSVASALGIGVAILLGGKWVILDPLVCCVISVFIVVVAVKMVIPAINELTEASLPDDVEEEIVGIIRSVEGVDDVHALKTRKNGTSVIIDSHIVVNPAMTVSEAHGITVLAEERLRARFGPETQISIHVEPSRESD